MNPNVRYVNQYGQPIVPPGQQMQQQPVAPPPGNAMPAAYAQQPQPAPGYAAPAPPPPAANVQSIQAPPPEKQSGLKGFLGKLNPFDRKKVSSDPRVASLEEARFHLKNAQKLADKARNALSDPSLLTGLKALVPGNADLVGNKVLVVFELCNHINAEVIAARNANKEFPGVTVARMADNQRFYYDYYSRAYQYDLAMLTQVLFEVTAARNFVEQQLTLAKQAAKNA